MAERTPTLNAETPAAETPPAEPERPAPTLAVSGIVLSKAQLMDALRPYVANIADLRPDADGEHFTVLFAPNPNGA